MFKVQRWWPLIILGSTLLNLHIERTKLDFYVFMLWCCTIKRSKVEKYCTEMSNVFWGKKYVKLFLRMKAKSRQNHCVFPIYYTRCMVWKYMRLFTRNSNLDVIRTRIDHHLFLGQFDLKTLLWTTLKFPTHFQCLKKIQHSFNVQAS